MSETYRVRFRLIITADTVIDAANPGKALAAVAEKVQAIVNREYEDQRSGLDPEQVDANLFYGLTLRLPGDIVVTGLDLRPGVDADDPGVDMDLEPPEEGRGPKLRLIQGGPASCCKEE